MQTVQTGHTFSLSGVKPLEALSQYRAFCLDAYEVALSKSKIKRFHSPIDKEVKLMPWKNISGIPYKKCPKTGSRFVAEVAGPKEWKTLLREVAGHLKSPEIYNKEIQRSRLQNIEDPKRKWIESGIRLNGLKEPTVLEVGTPFADSDSFLKKSPLVKNLLIGDAVDWSGEKGVEEEVADAAVLLETLDRVPDSDRCVQNVQRGLKREGLLFLTALVSSGFDTTVLAENNLYLFPPDRANCFSLEGLKQLLTKSGFELLEVSTPGVLDLEIVKAHKAQKRKIDLSPFEKELLAGDQNTEAAFRSFLQQSRKSSFARIVAKKL